MHAPPRLALLAALGLVALFPNLPLGGSVAAGNPGDGELYALQLDPVYPAGSSEMTLDLCVVSPGAMWAGTLATYHPDLPLLLPQIRSTCEVLLRSHDGLWAARSLLETHPSTTPLSMHLEPRGVLSGVVLDSNGKPMHCLVQAQGNDGTLYTVATSDDGMFRFGWLSEGKYQLVSPLTLHGRCEKDVLAIAGQEIHLRLEPQPTQGPPTEIIGQVQSRTGEYRESLYVRLWPLDAEAAPTHAKVVWDEGEGNVISGSFAIPATQGERYVLGLEKEDTLPATFTQAPILAPTQVNIFCEDSVPHADIVVRPRHEGDVDSVRPFEVALSWGDEVFWRASLEGEVRIEGLPTEIPIAWMVRSSDTATAYGEFTLKDLGATYRLNPRLDSGWGDGLRLRLPDGAPAANVLVSLDGVPAGRTDINGLLTLKRTQRPTYLSLETGNLRLFGAENSTRTIDSLKDRDELGRLLLVLLPRD